MAAMTVTYGFSRALEISSRMRLLEARELMVVRVRAGLERRMSMRRADLHQYPWVCWATTAWDGGNSFKFERVRQNRKQKTQEATTI